MPEGGFTSFQFIGVDPKSCLGPISRKLTGRVGRSHKRDKLGWSNEQHVTMRKSQGTSFHLQGPLKHCHALSYGLSRLSEKCLDCAIRESANKQLPPKHNAPTKASSPLSILATFSSTWLLGENASRKGLFCSPHL